MSFADLPLEIIPLIIQHLSRPQHLAQACLVSKDFYAYTVPLLYERIAIFAWQRKGKLKVTQLFWTLANCPQLARYVRRLELRDFPKAISVEGAQELIRTCVRAIGNCINLQLCTWTRDGSLTDDILRALSHCPHLEVLEINGHHVHSYDPDLLLKFTKLRRITFIMPSSEVVHVLPSCLQRNHETLQSLTIICKFTSVVTDSSLRLMAPALAGLKSLHIAGCPKVTQRGIIDLLTDNASGIVDLSLEGVSPSFDLKELGAFCFRTKALASLQSITFTCPVSEFTSEWLMDFEVLLRDAPLRQFHLYASGVQHTGHLSLDALFVQRLVSRHAAHLVRFAVLRFPISVHMLSLVVRSARKLEQLFITMWRGDLNKLGPIVAQSSSLRHLHVTYIPDMPADRLTDSEDEELGERVLMESNRFDAHRPPPSMEELETIASCFGPSVTQFGVQMRVWQVERERVRKPGGGDELSTAVRLGQYESADIPDVFLVVRT